MKQSVVWFVCLILLSLPQGVLALAFPTAEGYGANAVGGRGGAVYKVTNLNDSGGGSLRACMEDNNGVGARTCIFEVSGTIELQNAITVGTNQGFLTVAGQTAPNSGVQIKAASGAVAPIKLYGNHIIIRHLKLRAGVQGHPAFRDDLLALQIGFGTGSTTNNIILDHIEIDWAGYLNQNFYGAFSNVTVQWSIFASPNYVDNVYLGYNTIMTQYDNNMGQTLSWHHNLMMHSFGRLPQFSGARVNLFATVDYRNNYIYSWLACTPGVFGNDGGDGPFNTRVNFVGNKYVFNPAIDLSSCTFLGLGGDPNNPQAQTQVYVFDNSTPYCPGAPNCSPTEWNHSWADGNGAIANQGAWENRFRIFSPLNTPPIVTHSSANLESVLVNGTTGAIGVGPRRPVIDSETSTLLSELVNKTGSLGQNRGWPNLTTGGVGVPTDTDDDGIPDDYETNVLGTQLNNAADGATITPSGYSNLELYLNQLAGDGAMVQPPGNANPIYLSNSGNDTNSCTQAENINTPKATYGGAMGACTCMNVAGKILYVRGGTYNEVINTGTCPLTSGASASVPTTIEGYQNETAIFTTPVGGNSLLTVSTGAFLKFKKLTLDALSRPGVTAVYMPMPAQDIVIEDVTIRNATLSCAFIDNVERITFTGNLTPALNKMLLQNCGHGGIKTGGIVDGLRIERVTIDGTGQQGIDFGVFSGSTTNTLVNRSLIRNTGTAGANAAIDVGAGSGAVVQNSLIYDNNAGVRVRTGATNARIDNNTIANNTNVAFQCDTGASTIRLRNTILYPNGTNIPVNNCGMVETTNFVTDPLFTNSGADIYTLQDASTAINTGTTLPEIPQSYDGTPRPQGMNYDIGAYERSSSGPPLALAGRLIVDSGTGSNSRYFRKTTGEIVYLAGGYHWDFTHPTNMNATADDYLDQWVATNQNIIRTPNWDSTFEAPASNPPFNTAYFDFVASRIALAQSKGIYVMFTIFQHVDQAPFNNQAYCESYAQQVVDVLGVYDNVLFEVGNELITNVVDAGTVGFFSDRIVDVVKARQIANGRSPLPVGISDFRASGSSFTTQPAVITAMLASSADFLVIGWSEVATQQATVLPIDRPADNKVQFVDTDHIWPYSLNHVWVWKAFMRGLNPQVLSGNEWYSDHCEDDEGASCPLTFDATMRIGDTKLYADRVDMRLTVPHPEWSSTGWALVNPGVSYLVYQPGSGAFNVTLVAGTYAVEWFNATTQAVQTAAQVTGSGSTSFTPPFADAVLFLNTPPVGGPLGVLSALLHVDQFGYLPTAEKVAVLSDPQTGYNAAENYTPGTIIEVRQFSDNTLMFSGSRVAWNAGATHTQSGDKVWRYDFSSVVTPGEYYLYDPTNNLRSDTFEIREDIYTQVLKDAVRMFFYQRFGFAKLPPYTDTKWQDTSAAFMGTQQDTQARLISDPTNAATARDIRGGWFDAGDYNAYTTFAVTALDPLLEAYEFYPGVFPDGGLDIPESGNGISDLLDEIKYELDWLLRMQTALGGSGAVSGKKSGVSNAARAAPPSADTNFRYYGPTSTMSTAMAAGIFARAAKAFQPFNASGPYAGYATTLENAAIAAWGWASVNTAVDFVNTGFDTVNPEGNYGNGGNAEQVLKFHNYWQPMSLLYASSFLYALTGSSTYKTYFDANYALSEATTGDFLSPYETWVQNALLAYTRQPGATSAVVTDINTAWTQGIQFGNWLAAVTDDTDAYRSFMYDGYYSWGSNRQKAHSATVYFDLIRHNLSPANHTSYRNAASGYLHYLHGVNPNGIVFLTNMYHAGAERSTNEIYHWWFWWDTIWSNALTSTNGPAPGFVPGGPNPAYDGSLTPPLSQPIQKSWVDDNNESSPFDQKTYMITEPAIYYQAAYIQMLAAFAAPAPTIPPPTPQAGRVPLFIQSWFQ